MNGSARLICSSSGDRSSSFRPGLLDAESNARFGQTFAQAGDASAAHFRQYRVQNGAARYERPASSRAPARRDAGGYYSLPKACDIGYIAMRR